MTSTSSFTLAQTVIGRLRAAILSGRYLPGSRLTELGLAEDMKTSRTPVIAALKALTEQGLVRYASNRGYWVREFSIEEVLEAYDIRGTLEGMACRLAAEHGVPASASGLLRRCLEIGERIVSGDALRESDHEAYQQLNVDFHSLLLQASNNHQLGDFVRRANEIPLASDRTVMWSSLAVVQRSHDAHVRILDAVLNGQGTRAEMLMREHVYEAGQVMKECWPGLLARAQSLALATTDKQGKEA
ncbi:GntR family transcriptional regulator [Achromobacter sp. NPDC058515]|uniref:GntR family transcriptional regulator n=1 Tax=Achromobacter sp. NPDC058515 TaxID=3346533 RepID=UPI0036639F33